MKKWHIRGRNKGLVFTKEIGIRIKLLTFSSENLAPTLSPILFFRNLFIFILFAYYILAFEWNKNMEKCNVYSFRPYVFQNTFIYYIYTFIIYLFRTIIWYFLVYWLQMLRHGFENMSLFERFVYVPLEMCGLNFSSIGRWMFKKQNKLFVSESRPCPRNFFVLPIDFLFFFYFLHSLLVKFLATYLNSKIELVMNFREFWIFYSILCCFYTAVLNIVHFLFTPSYLSLKILKTSGINFSPGIVYTKTQFLKIPWKIII